MNKEQLDIIFRKHYTDLCKIAYKKVGDFQIAEDLVQDLFLEFWNRKTNFFQIDQVSNYLRRSISLKCIDYINSKIKQSGKLIMLDGVDIEEDKDWNYNEGNDERWTMLLQSIEKLPPKRKAVFILSRFDNKSYKEIASDLDISVKSVEKHIGKALLQLRSLLRIVVISFLSYLS